MNQLISPYLLPGLQFELLTSRQRRILRKTIPANSLEVIEKIVCEFFGITSMLIRTRRRDRHIVWPRHVYYYLCYHNTSFSMKQIGASLCGHDHTTVINAMGTVKDLIQTDPKIKNQMLQLQNQVKSRLS